MKAILGVLALVVVLAIVGSLAKKQLAANSLAGRAADAQRAATLPVGAPAPSPETVPQQAQALQHQARDGTLKALQEGAERNQRADP